MEKKNQKENTTLFAQIDSGLTTKTQNFQTKIWKKKFCPSAAAA